MSFQSISGFMKLSNSDYYLSIAIVVTYWAYYVNNGKSHQDEDDKFDKKCFQHFLLLIMKSWRNANFRFGNNIPGNDDSNKVELFVIISQNFDIQHFLIFLFLFFFAFTIIINIILVNLTFHIYIMFCCVIHNKNYSFSSSQHETWFHNHYLNILSMNTKKCENNKGKKIL